MSFLKSEWLKIAALLLLIICIPLGIWYYGKTQYQQGYDVAATFYRARETSMSDKSQIINAKTEANQASAAQAAVESETKVKIVYRDRIKEVVRYEKSNPDDALLPIGNEWVYQHDQLATKPGEAPPDRSAYGADSAAARITKADTLKTIGVNYEAYNICVDRVKIWEMFDRRQMDIINNQ